MKPRDYKSVRDNPIDFKMCLIEGRPLKVDNLVIEPYTIREINDIGYTEYMRLIQTALVTVDDFISSIDDLEKRMILMAEKSKMKSFDFFMSFGGEDLRNSFIRSLSVIFKTEDIFVIDEKSIAFDFFKLGVITVDEYGDYDYNKDVLADLDDSQLKILNRDNYEHVFKIIEFQNFFKQVEDKSVERKPADEETRKLLEEMEANRKKVAKAKKSESEDEDPLDFYDMIESVSTKSNSVNKLTIWDYNVFQLYTEYLRLEKISNHELTTMAKVFAGGDIEIEHWSSKL